MWAGRWIAIVAAVTMTSIAIAACGGSDETTQADQPDPPSKPADRPVDEAGDGRGGVELVEIGSFDQPVFVIDAPGATGADLYVVEQCGRIQRLPSDGGEAVLFLDISDQVSCGGEQGLLSVAFDPRSEDRFYVYFTDTEGTTRIVEYRRSKDDPGVADPESARELLAIEDFAANHNGGLLAFGPDDRLYAGTGDGGGSGDPERTAQDPDSLLGKLLTIDTQSGDAEIVALGLRNPWRYSFDSRGNVWIGDVGQDSLEEIDVLGADQLDAREPANFGWSAFEGTERFNSDQKAPDAIEPVFQYGRDGGCSVTGGYVIENPELESLIGRYLYGDYCAGELRSFTARPAQPAEDDQPLGVDVSSLSSFGLDARGNYYAVSLDGPVYRLAPEG